MPQLQKGLLVGAILWAIAQVAAATVVLVIAHGDACDSPLYLYVIVYIVRIVLNLPVTIAERLHSLSEMRRDEQAAQQAPAETGRGRRGRGRNAQTAAPTATAALEEGQAQDTHNAEPASQRHVQRYQMP